MIPYLQGFSLIFWDFDGVIKESTEIKTAAFRQLFSDYGSEIVCKIETHHRDNGGLSRFTKFPIYLEWAGESSDSERLADLDRRFSALVVQGVINAPWVPGVESIIRTNPYRQTFVLVSATPQHELEVILRALKLEPCFEVVYGAPTSKQDAIYQSLQRYALAPGCALMIGDALADYEAALVHQVSFLLRHHETNRNIFTTYTGASIKDFT